jgi:hypothetical protein
MKTAIAQDPAGIGYVSVGHIDQTVAAVAIDSAAPTTETVTSGNTLSHVVSTAIPKAIQQGSRKNLLSFYAAVPADAFSAQP